MKKIDLGQTISILANIGVIAGIIFLGYEMRQNTSALKSGAAQNINNQIAGINELRMDPEIMSLIIKGDAHPEDLSAVEKQQYFSYLSTILHAWQNMYVQMREGAYDEDSLSGWWRVLRENFETPGFVEYWNTRAFVLSPDFREFVETEVMRIPLDSE